MEAGLAHTSQVLVLCQPPGLMLPLDHVNKSAHHGVIQNVTGKSVALENSGGNCMTAAEHLWMWCKQPVQRWRVIQHCAYIFDSCRNKAISDINPGSVPLPLLIQAVYKASKWITK